MNIWSRLGISVAIAAVFCIVVTEAFQHRSYYESFRWHICASFMVLGVVLWIIGRFINAKFRAAAAAAAAEAGPPDEFTGEELPEEQGPFLLINLAYWGGMLVVFGIIIIFINPTYEKPGLVVAAATVAQPVAPPAPAPEVLPEPELPKEPTAFPPLKIQGIVYRPPNSSVLINGKTFFLGDTVGDAKVVAINEFSATLELEGQQKVLVLPR